MGLAVIAMVGGLVVGLVRGGSLTRLGSLRLRARRLVALAVLVQLVAALLARTSPVAYASALALSGLAMIVFLAANRRVEGVALVAAGLLLNAVVVTSNGAMPVSLDAAARAGIATGPIAGGEDPRHELVTARTHLPDLGDVVPLPLPLRPEVLSPGDLLLAAGLGLLVAQGMLEGTDPRRRRGEEGSEAAGTEEEDREPRQAPERVS